MGPSVLQVGLFASLLILVSCASITPRSPQPEARRGFGAGGGGGGGGVGGGGAGGGWGFGGGFGGGGSRPGGEEDADGDDSGEDGGEDGGDGGGDGDGEGGDDGGSSGGDDCDYDEEEGDGGEQGEEGPGEEEEGGEDEADDEDVGDSGDDGEGSSRGDCDCDSEPGYDDGDDGGTSDEANDKSTDNSDCGNGSGAKDIRGLAPRCYRSTSEVKQDQSTKLKTPDMGETSLPSPLWQSAGKLAHRSFSYGYHYDGHSSNGEPDVGGHSHGHVEDMWNIFAVIPMVFSPFRANLGSDRQIMPLNHLLRSFTPNYLLKAPIPLLRFKRNPQPERERDEAGEMIQDLPSEGEDTPLAAEEGSMDNEFEDTSPVELNNVEQENESIGESETELGAEAEKDEIMREVEEQQREITQQLVLSTLPLDPNTQLARSTRSGGMKITEVIEDLKSAPKSNDKLRLLPAISLDKLLSLELDLQAGR